MLKFILRRLGLLLLTMFIVSIAVFSITEAAPGNIARNVLGAYITPEQEQSFLAQMGLDRPLYQRYLFWLIGNDWLGRQRIGRPLTQIQSEQGYMEWWALEEDGSPVRWHLDGNNLITRYRQPDGTFVDVVENERWRIHEPYAEAERLTEFRQEVEENPAIPPDEKAIILAQLDRILDILSEDLEETQLALALSEPEQVLDTLIDPKVLELDRPVNQAVIELRRDDIYEVITVLRQISALEAGTLPSGQATLLGNKLLRAAERLEGIDAESAELLRDARGALIAAEIPVAIEKLEEVMPALENVSGDFIALVDGLDQGDYYQALLALQGMADMIEQPLSPAQVDILTQQLRSAGRNLRTVHPELRQLSEAADLLAEGDIADARESAMIAVARMNQISQMVNTTESARTAKVMRTFWGVDRRDRVVLWERGGTRIMWRVIPMGMVRERGGAVEYLPLQRGLLRGDPGVSVRTQRPVAETLFRRLRNSLVLAGIAFVVVMPLALVLGLIAGVNEGKPIDRILTVGGLVTTVIPEFATGIFLILIFAWWLGLVPGATVFGEHAPWERPDMLVLPVLTLTLLELGYVLRITRQSMAEVMRSAYIRTAFLKGLPHWRVVMRHAVRNALIAPITVIMLHVNWLIGGIVIVEAVFGYPGLGKYLLDSALFRDYNAIQAGAMVLVAVAVGTQLIADIIYTFLNPRIRYA